MKLFLSLLLLLMALSAQAEIYKGTDSDDQTTYSDQPLPGSVIIPTPSPNTIQMPRPEPRKPVERPVIESSPYTQFSIISPANDETIRDNTGNIPVSFLIEPELDIERGHRINVYLDGQVAVSNGTELTLPVVNAGRGAHTINARVIDGKGKTLISSSVITIHIKRFSIQHKKPTGTPPGPISPDGTPYLPGPDAPGFRPNTNLNTQE
ncbi:MAG: DUF4124 domain-containing protein [Gammaproteobacteria bacterium]|nr:DUF4124 domain-containing protein [Gammaproteobacteria bacterium]